VDVLTLPPFTPAPWLRGPHRQTVSASLLIPAPRLRYDREILELPDGDLTALDWAGTDHDGPLHLILHGMEGDSQSRYVRRLAHASLKRGWRVAVLHMRSCGGLLNRKRTFYHAGWYQDLEWLIGEHWPVQESLLISAVSLGGSQLIHFLGRSPYADRVRSAVAISTPLWLRHSADYMAQGLNRWYIYKFRRTLVRKYRAKSDLIQQPGMLSGLARARNFWDLDNRATAPLHGYRDAEEYYDHNSAGAYLEQVAVPLLLVTARDDPFIPPHSLPESSPRPNIRCLFPEQGGHAAFIQADGHSWLESVVPVFHSHGIRSPKQQTIPKEGIFP